MTNEQAAPEIIHTFGIICLVASLLIRVLPLPEEIPSRHYRIFYDVFRRCSLNAGNGVAAKGACLDGGVAAKGASLDGGGNGNGSATK